ncbi:MAG: PorT family protein [Bacteroidia bacterium]|nr:PorT family protein [Bacteroidia bacterium]
MHVPQSQPSVVNTIRLIATAVFLFAMQLAFMSSLSAQSLKFGPRIGIASSPVNAQNIQNFNDFAVSFQEGSSEYQIGVFGRLQAFGLFIQPEFLFTTSSAAYLVEDLRSGGQEIFKEQYYNVEMPVMAGFKLGPIRLQGGPVYRLNLGNSSDFFTTDGFSRSFQNSNVGIQTGVGLDIGKKLVFDLKYELPLSDTGDEISILGQTHDLSSRGSHFVASMGISF